MTMENVTSTPNVGKSSTSGAAQKLSSDFKDIKSDASGLADRTSQAAKDLGTHASDAFEDLKSAGQEVIDEYAARGKKQFTQAASRISDYADSNTALVAGGALVVGILLGHILTRKGE
jgi:ElaB/YqjD/DUF883 family membrane-anchored ribosome-binding protein